MSMYLGGVKYHRGKARRHLTVETNLDTRLDLVLSFYQRIKELIGMDDCLAIVRHQTDKCSIPLIDDLRKRGRS